MCGYRTADFDRTRRLAEQPRVLALLREHGLVTFTGITSRTALANAARGLMSIRPHRDAGPDGVTVITGTGTTDPGYAAFTDAELIPHTDGTSLPDPPPSPVPGYRTACPFRRANQAATDRL